MKKSHGKTLFLGVALILTANYLLNSGSRSSPARCCLPLSVSMSAFAAETGRLVSTNAPSKASLPRLVDLGADKCIPCKMMAPILKDLKKEFEGQMQVEFIDVWKNPDAGKPYKINLIPTQIFFDAAGKELFRHEGYFSKDDILAKWKELGVSFRPKAEKASGAKS